MSWDIIAYIISTVIGIILVTGLGLYYKKFKNLIKVLNQVLEDDQITADEIRQILKILVK